MSGAGSHARPPGSSGDTRSHRPHSLQVAPSQVPDLSLSDDMPEGYRNKYGVPVLAGIPWRDCEAGQVVEGTDGDERGRRRELFPQRGGACSTGPTL